MKKILLLFLPILFFVSSLFAAEISQLELYRRCTIHLTGKPIPFGSPVVAKIKNGEMKAKQACEELLNAGLLAEDGQLQNPNPVGKAVLKTFMNFHRTWFSANTLEQIQDYTEEVARGTVDIYDPNEPALALTKALLGKNSSYSDVLTAKTGVKALRVEDEKVKARLGYTSPMPSRRLFGNGVNETDPVSFRNMDSFWISTVADRKPDDLKIMPHIQVGDLVGIQNTTEAFQIQNLDLHPLGASTPGHLEAELNYAYDFYKTQGGGVLGTPSFFLMNYGHPLGLKANGSTKIPRRWIRSAMESFLCVSFPALRETDIENFFVGNSTTSFRNGKSCLQCHGTFDQAAYTGRNIILGGTDFAGLTNFFNKNPVVMTTYKASKDSVAGWPSEPVVEFHLQKPTGALYFRSASGALINTPVQNISDLGLAMSKTDDFYNCAARRYFEYFTGIHVLLYDKTDPLNAGLNRRLQSQDIKDRQYVEKLGRDLKKSQSMAQLINSIMSSDYYKSVNYRP